MRSEHRKTIAAAWLAWAITVVAYILDVVFMVLNGPKGPDEPSIVVLAIEDFAFVIVATLALVVIRAQPTNIVGWWLMLPGITFPLEGFLYEFARYSLDTWGKVGATLGAGWILRWVWIGSQLAIPLILLYYPNGKLPSSRWRPAAVFVWGVAALSFLYAFDSEPIKELDNLQNPLGIDSFGPLTPVFGVLWVTYFALPVLGAISVFARFRNSTGVERQQVKLILWVAGVAVMFFLVTGIFDLSDEANSIVNTMFTLYVAGTITAGIVRYRLFEIDRIISRTVAYALVVGLLGGGYFVLIAILSSILPSSNALVVAGSTLAVASLFNPVQKRVKAIVDKRFNRSNYEAQLVAEQFASELRDSQTLDELATSLVSTVESSLQPESIGIWVASADA